MSKEDIDLLEDRQAWQRRKEASEKAKIELSGAPKARISLPLITADATGPKHIEETLSSAKFEPMAASLMQTRLKRAGEDHEKLSEEFQMTMV